MSNDTTRIDDHWEPATPRRPDARDVRIERLERINARLREVLIALRQSLRDGTLSSISGYTAAMICDALAYDGKEGES